MIAFVEESISTAPPSAAIATVAPPRVRPASESIPTAPVASTSKVVPVVIVVEVPLPIVTPAAVAARANVPVVAVAVTPSFPVIVMVPPPSASVSVAEIVKPSFVAFKAVVSVPVKTRSFAVRLKSSFASIITSSSAPI